MVAPSMGERSLLTPLSSACPSAAGGPWANAPQATGNSHDSDKPYVVALPKEAGRIVQICAGGFPFLRLPFLCPASSLPSIPSSCLLVLWPGLLERGTAHWSL